MRSKGFAFRYVLSGIIVCGPFLSQRLEYGAQILDRRQLKRQIPYPGAGSVFGIMPLLLDSAPIYSKIDIKDIQCHFFYNQKLILMFLRLVMGRFNCKCRKMFEILFFIIYQTKVLSQIELICFAQLFTKKILKIIE